LDIVLELLAFTGDNSNNTNDVVDRGDANHNDDADSGGISGANGVENGGVAPAMTLLPLVDSNALADDLATPLHIASQKGHAVNKECVWRRRGTR
jgi:hypothetical protein